MDFGFSWNKRCVLILGNINKGLIIKTNKKFDLKGLKAPQQCVSYEIQVTQVTLDHGARKH